MAAPIVYRWDDGNAPVARGERRSLCDILYACLVTGYGEKPGAGWTREFVNATFDKAAFRNNPITGTGFFLQVDGFGAANAYTPRVQGFEAMTSENDGLFPFNASVQTIATSNGANSTARPWILIADDRAFYFICWSTITAAPGDTDVTTPGMFFGDINKFEPDDAYACALSVGSNATLSFGYLLGPSAATALIYQGACFPRPISGIYEPYIGACVRGGGPGSEGRAGEFGAPYSPGGAILVSQPHLSNGPAYSLRGWWPGFFYPCHPLAFGQLQNVSADGRAFVSIRAKVVNGNGNIFISIDDWRS